MISIGLILAMLFSPVMAAGDNLLAKEYLVKSAFLYNFARLVDWPEEIFISDEAPVNICLMGNDVFAGTINTIRNKEVRNRKIHILHNVTLKKVHQCHILFISASKKNMLHRIINKLKDYPILMVSELPGFAHQNGHIRFYISSDNTLSLEVNLNAIKRSNLHISSRILTLAKIVSSDEALEP